MLCKEGYIGPLCEECDVFFCNFLLYFQQQKKIVIRKLLESKIC